MLAFRITRPYDQLSDFITKLANSSQSLIVYEHESSRVHIHGLVSECKVGKETLKNWVKDALNCKQFPKSDWSFITQDKQGNVVNDNFITYMSKGILQPRFVNGYTTESVEQYRLQWKPIERKRIQYVLKQENPHEAKKRQSDMIDEICRRVDSQKLVLAEDIINVICEVVHKENKTIIGRYKIRDYYDMVLYRTHKDTFVRQMINLCTKV